MKCSDCGLDIEDTTLEGVCADRGGHEARCTCAVPGMLAGLARGYGCPIHTDAAPRGRQGRR